MIAQDKIISLQINLTENNCVWYYCRTTPKRGNIFRVTEKIPHCPKSFAECGISIDKKAIFVTNFVCENPTSSGEFFVFIRNNCFNWNLQRKSFLLIFLQKFSHTSYRVWSEWRYRSFEFHCIFFVFIFPKRTDVFYLLRDLLRCWWPVNIYISSGSGFLSKNSWTSSILTIKHK